MDYCILCSRDFASREAYAQHVQESPVHNKKIHCQTCDCFFGTKEEFEQHQQHSLVHNMTFRCQNCTQSFGSNKKLKNHRRLCQAASGWPLNPFGTPSSQSYEKGVSSNAWPKSPTVDPRSFLLDHFARMSILTMQTRIATHSQIATKDVPRPTQETREFFKFPELHPDVAHAVSPEISSIWFNDENDNDDDDDGFDNRWFTHVMGRFMCNNNFCKKHFWDSGMVPIEIRGYKDNGYSAIVYNQRCTFCYQLGTLKLDERSYIERVAYRLKKWAGVEMKTPPYNNIRRPDHKRTYCEGCKRGKCLHGDGVNLY